MDTEKILLVLIYREPGQNNYFCDVFTDLPWDFSSTYRAILSEGFSFDQRVNYTVEKLIPLLSEFNFWQDNQIPVLRLGCILDLVFNGSV